MADHSESEVSLSLSPFLLQAASLAVAMPPGEVQLLPEVSLWFQLPKADPSS